MRTRRSSLVLGIGILLLILGAGNYWFGNKKADEYRHARRQAAAALDPRSQRPYAGTESILERPSDAELVYESASAKYAYYRVVRRGGRMFAAMGLLLVVGGATRRILVPSR